MTSKRCRLFDDAAAGQSYSGTENDSVPPQLRFLQEGWKILFFKSTRYRPNLTRSVEWNRGAYLAEGLGDCGGCHTPRNAFGAEKTRYAYSGAVVDNWIAPALTERVRALRNDLVYQTFRPGHLRFVGAGWTNWAVESFMDEAAHAVGVDPVAFRLRMLDGVGRNAGSAPNSVGGAHRQAAVLRRAAEKSGWGKAIPDEVGVGVASTFGQERTMPTWVACVARVRVNRTDGYVTVEKLTLVIDAGTIIHPDSAAAQVEGAALWGMSMALYEGSEFIDGQPKDSNPNTYMLLRMSNVPEIEIEFLPSSETPVGLGEPATTAVAPAIGNAIFSASGVRLRHLPIRPEAVRQALASRG